ncbi:MAG: BCCT family transporter [Tessaracoccus sp.]|nr:BCCT family transporter [Tessaracoccus sp.]
MHMSVSTAPEQAPPVDVGPKPRPDLVLVLGSVLVVGIVVAALLIWPDSAKDSANMLFNGSTRIFGVPVQALGLGCLLMAVVFAASRIGSIKLGEGKPQYSTPAWLFMFITAGLGSATMYWAFMEWAYYYLTPGLNITPESREALDMSTAYVFFHWGPIPWAMYVVAGVSMAYYFHVRKGKRLSYAGNVEAVTNGRLKADGLAGRIIDILFLFGTFGSLILTVTLTVNTVSAGVSGLAGTGDSLWLKTIILLSSALVFGISSYLGLDSGLQRLAKLAVGATFVFGAIIFLIGPTEFIAHNTLNAFGLEIQNFVHMSLFTDPTEGGSFARDWTVFYWLYWLSYLPGVAIFIARVSKGRTIRQTVIGLICGGCAGILVFFGPLTSFAIDRTTSGAINVPQVLQDKGGDFAVAELLASLPLGAVFSVAYFIIMLLFLASHLDATAFTISTVSTKHLPHGSDPARGFRLFWVLMLVTLPFAMIAIDADLGVLKTGLTLTAVPFIFLIVAQIIGLVRWLRNDMQYLDPATGLMRLPAALLGADASDNPTHTNSEESTHHADH